MLLSSMYVAYGRTSRSGCPGSIGWIRHPTSDIINFSGFLFISISVLDFLTLWPLDQLTIKLRFFLKIKHN